MVSPAAGEASDSDWHARLPVFLSATAQYSRDESSHRQRVSISGLVELQLRKNKNPWTIGPIVELRHFDDPDVDTVINAGAIFRHAHRRWDTTGLVLRHMPRRSKNAWVYAARVRYRVAPSGKIGVEIFGPMQKLDSPTLMTGFYGDLSATLSFRALIGGTINQPGSRAARVELIWQMR